MIRKVGKNAESGIASEKSSPQTESGDSEIMGKLNRLAQEISDLQTAISGQDQQKMAAESTPEQTSIPSASASDPISAKLQELSQLRYELSNELTASLEHLQVVMDKSKKLVDDLNQWLQGQNGR